MPVLWEKYNYGVYKVSIENTSEDEGSSAIDYFNFVLRVPNDQNDSRGVLEKDMMAWAVDSNGNYTANSDTGNREQNYGGKYKEGGALIWDVTGKDMSNFDLDTYAKAHASEYTYIYSSPGEM